MARVVRYLLIAVLSPFRRVAALVLWRAASRRVIAGIEVADLDDRNPERTFAAVAAALQILAGTGDLHLRRVQ